MSIRPNFKDIYGPWALVTGAASGLGKEFTNQLAAQKLNIIAVDIQEELLNQQVAHLAEKYGMTVVPALVDLAEADCLERLQAIVGEREVGLLANVAAVAPVREF